MIINWHSKHILIAISMAFTDEKPASMRLHASLEKSLKSYAGYLKIWGKGVHGWKPIFHLFVDLWINCEAIIMFRLVTLRVIAACRLLIMYHMASSMMWSRPRSVNPHSHHVACYIMVLWPGSRYLHLITIHVLNLYDILFIFNSSHFIYMFQCFNILYCLNRLFFNVSISTNLLYSKCI